MITARSSFIVPFVVLTAFVLSSCDYSREATLLEKSGLDITRRNVTRTFSEEISIRFGAEGRSKLAFQLPEDYSGLENCGTRGFGAIESLEYPEANIELQDGCIKRVALGSGTDLIFALLDEHIFITVYY